jgi:ATP synthase I chain
VTDASSGLLRRLEIGALVWTAVAIGVVLVGWRTRTDVMLGIAGGGLLSVASFYAIRATVDAVVRRTGTGPGLLVKVAGRYGLLALLAYVMIARLRLHPLGLLVGATALVASATAEAVRGLGRPGAAS